MAAGSWLESRARHQCIQVYTSSLSNNDGLHVSTNFAASLTSKYNFQFVKL